MGRQVQFDAAADGFIELEPPTPLSEEVIDHARALLTRMAEQRADALRAELDRWSGSDPSADAAWMRDHVAEELSFFEAELDALADPEQSVRVVEDFLAGASN